MLYLPVGSPDPPHVPFSCPGCGRADDCHPPLCMVCVRLTAAAAKSADPAGWREALRSSAAWWAVVFGCRWYPVARHFRRAAEDDPPDGDPGETLAYCPGDGFRPDGPPSQTV